MNAVRRDNEVELVHQLAPILCAFGPKPVCWFGPFERLDDVLLGHRTVS